MARPAKYTTPEEKRQANAARQAALRERRKAELATLRAASKGKASQTQSNSVSLLGTGDALKEADTTALLEEIARRVEPQSLRAVVSAWVDVGGCLPDRFEYVAGVVADLAAEERKPRGEVFVERPEGRYVRQQFAGGRLIFSPALRPPNG